MARNIQAVLKRDSFVIKSLIIGEAISLFNFLSFYFFYDELTQPSPWPLYHACLDPWKKFQFPFSKVVPVNQLILHISTIVNIACNLWLFSYLKKMTDKNTALKPSDKKKEKKRNLMPAQVGFLSMIIYFITMVMYTSLYAYKSETFDSATRAFCIAVYADFFHCLFSPLVILLGSADARRRIKDMWSRFIEYVIHLYS